MAALLAAGKTVLIPFGVQGYDLVFEDEDGFHRVQCKTAYMRNGDDVLRRLQQDR
jgi:hypothetical protein